MTRKEFIEVLKEVNFFTKTYSEDFSGGLEFFLNIQGIILSQISEAIALDCFLMELPNYNCIIELRDQLRHLNNKGTFNFKEEENG